MPQTDFHCDLSVARSFDSRTFVRPSCESYAGLQELRQ